MSVASSRKLRPPNACRSTFISSTENSSGFQSSRLHSRSSASRWCNSHHVVGDRAADRLPGIAGRHQPNRGRAPPSHDAMSRRWFRPAAQSRLPPANATRANGGTRGRPAPAGSRPGDDLAASGHGGTGRRLPPVNATWANVGPRGREWRPEGGGGQHVPDRGQAADDASAAIGGGPVDRDGVGEEFGLLTPRYPGHPPGSSMWPTLSRPPAERLRGGDAMPEEPPFAAQFAAQPATASQPGRNSCLDCHLQISADEFRPIAPHPPGPWPSNSRTQQKSLTIVAASQRGPWELARQEGDKMPESHVTAFVGATSFDMQSYREVAKCALLTGNIFPITQEHMQPDCHEFTESLRSRCRGATR